MLLRAQGLIADCGKAMWVRKTGGTGEGSRFEAFRTSNRQLRTPDRAFHARLALRAPRSIRRESHASFRGELPVEIERGRTVPVPPATDPTRGADGHSGDGASSSAYEEQSWLATGERGWGPSPISAPVRPVRRSVDGADHGTSHRARPSTSAD